MTKVLVLLYQHIFFFSVDVVLETQRHHLRLQFFQLMSEDGNIVDTLGVIDAYVMIERRMIADVSESLKAQV